MRETDDIAPLVEIAEREYLRLTQDAYNSLIALQGFWTRLYGPNEALMVAFDALAEMDKTWNESDVGEGVTA